MPSDQTDTSQEDQSIQTAPPASGLDTTQAPTIDLSNGQETQPTIDLSPPAPIKLTPDGVEQRAGMAHYALQEKSPGVSSLKNVIQQGGEDNLRQTATVDRQLALNDMAFGIIRNIASRRGGDLSPDEQDGIVKLVQNTSRENPDTVLEKMWSNNYVKELLNNPSKVVKDAMLTSPAKSLTTAGYTDQLIANRQLGLSIHQEFAKRYDDMPWNPIHKEGDGQWDKLSAFLTSSLGPYNKYLLHGAPGAGNYATSWNPGQNLNEVSDFYYLMKPDDFNTSVRAHAEELWAKSPDAAMQFLEAVTNRPDNAATVDNMMAVADVASVIPGGLVARGFKAAERAGAAVAARAPVAVNKAFVEANRDIIFSNKEADQLLKTYQLDLQKGNTDYKTSRMASIRLTEAVEAFPEVSRYPSSLIPQNSPAGSLGPINGTLDAGVTPYRIGEQRLTSKGDTMFVDPAELAKLPEGARIYQTGEGDLKVSQQLEGKWTPTGQSLKTTTEPQQGLVSLDLGTGKQMLGANYWDDYKVSAPVTAVERNLPTPIQADNIPAQMLGTKVDLSPRTELNQQVKTLEMKLSSAQKDLDAASAEGNIQGRAFQQKIVDQTKKDLDVALTERNRVTLNTTMEGANEQSFRSYMAAGFKALKQIPTGTGVGLKSDVQGTLTTIGKIPDAVDVGTVRKLDEILNGTDDPIKAMDSMQKDLMDLLKPNPNIANASSLSREGAARLTEGLQRKSIQLQNAMTQGNRVQRLTKDDLMQIVRSTKSQVLDEYTPEMHNAVTNMWTEWHPETNTYHVKTMVGKTDATYWESEEEARNTISQQYKVPLGNFDIRQQGTSFVGVIDTPINEAGAVKSKLIPTNNVTPRTWRNQLFGIWGAEDQTSELQRAARHVGTSAPQELKAAILDVGKDIRLKGEETDQLRNILNEGRLDWDDQGRMGKWYDVTELEQKYLARYNKNPSEQFIKAYYTYKQLHDFDYLMRAQGLYASMTRWGAKNYSFLLPKGGNAESFVGREVTEFDMRQNRDRGILYVNDSDKKMTLLRTSEKALWENEINQKLKSEDYKIIQLFAPLKKPLANSTDNHGDIYYVVTNSSSKSNLAVRDLVDYREGTHVVYTHQHFLKQPMVGKDASGQPVYMGDNTFRSGGASEREARAWAIKYDTARQLLLAGDDSALSNYLRNNLPESIEDFKNIFRGDNALDASKPIAYSKGGYSTFDANPELIDGTYNGVNHGFGKLKDWREDFANPEQYITSNFLQERADQPLMVAKDLGINIPNRFRLDQAAMLDPYMTLNRAVGQAVRSRYMDDYKVLAAESFVKEFGKYILDASEEALQRNPIHFLVNANVNKGAPADVKAAFKQYQANVQNFIGMKSELANTVDHFEGKMLNLMDRVRGSEKTAKMVENPTFTNVILPMIKDPFAYARAAAFNVRLGFFNPLQLWVQAQTTANAIAQSPIHGMNGLAAASWLRLGARGAMDDPAKLAWYARAAERSSGWTRQEFTEAIDAYKNSGIARVAGETAWRDDVFDPKLMQTKLGRVLDAGSAPFQAGERIVRDTSFFTAWKEWKVDNPGRVADQYDMGKIMNRYDQLSLNMTRASNSSIQQGAMSIPTQFYTFSQRQFEQFWGNRLTGGEKLRVGMMYSALYGIPVTVSSASLIPVYDIMRSQFVDQNKIDIHSGYFQAMHEGILSLLLSKSTGKETDLATRMGPNANSLLADAYHQFAGDEESSKTVAQLLTGPSGQLVADSMRALWPFWAAFKTSITDPENKYPILMEDFNGLFKDVSTLNNAQKFWAAYNMHKYFTKNGQYVGDVDTFDGALMFLFGLTPQKFSDDFKKGQTIHGAQGVIDSFGKTMITDMQAMTEAAVSGDSERVVTLTRRIRAMQKMADMKDTDVMNLFIKSGYGFASKHEQLNSIQADPRQSSMEDFVKNIQNKQGKQ